MIQPSLWRVLEPKWRTALQRLREERSRGPGRLLILVLAASGFWLGVFGILYRILKYFRGVEDVGPLLAGKILGVVLLAFVGILVLSNVITALSSFFLSKDLDLLLSAVAGSALTLVLVNIFPARRTRDLLSIVALGAVGVLILLFRLIRPERLASPEGFRNLVEFIAVLRTPTSPYLPSEWAAQAVMGFLRGKIDLLPLALLWSTAGSFVVLGATLHRQ